METRIESKYTVYMHIFPNEKKYVGITGQKPTALAIKKAKESCNKAVMCLATGFIYESATIAATETGEHRNTITRHCRNEVRCPRWKFLKS